MPTEAFETALVALIPGLRGLATVLAGRGVDADDLVQQTLERAWQAHAKFAPGTNLKAWTYTILRNEFYSEKRRSWRRTQLDPELAERTLVAADDPEIAVDLDQLRLAMQQLPLEQREALTLVSVSKLSYEETAALCRCAVGTVKSRVSRARRALARIIYGGQVQDEGAAALDAMAKLLEDAERLRANKRDR